MSKFFAGKNFSLYLIAHDADTILARIYDGPTALADDMNHSVDFRTDVVELATLARKLRGLTNSITYPPKGKK